MQVKITIDPLSKWTTTEDHRLLQACGILIDWIMHAPQDTLMERLIKNYCFYIGAMKGGTLTKEGVYSYPDGPDLHPLVQFEHGSEICFIFQYGMVGIYNTADDSTWVTRMD